MAGNPSDTVLVVVLGPTATGKTEVAMQWSEELGGEIVSADSGQVYRYMDVGTAKPTRAQQERVSHHLIDVVDPDQTFSAAQYQQMADEAIVDIHARGKVPLVVGGTGLYLKVLTRGLFKGPAADRTLRCRLQEQAEAEGLAALHLILQRIDEEAARRIHPNDAVRIIRALEVYYLTGIPISHHQKRHRFLQERYRAIYFGLAVEREPLYQRINARVDKMMEQGLVAEVEKLLCMGYYSSLPAMQALGYRHMVNHLLGNQSLLEAVDTLKRDTRHFARRQANWFRRMPAVNWFRPDEARTILRRIQRFVEGGADSHDSNTFVSRKGAKDAKFLPE
jgi:tRNA dimethylallyltransferase